MNSDNKGAFIPMSVGTKFHSMLVSMLYLVHPHLPSSDCQSKAEHTAARGIKLPPQAKSLAKVDRPAQAEEPAGSHGTNFASRLLHPMTNANAETFYGL